MGHLEHKSAAPKSVKCAVITVSDSRTPDTDDSGKILIKLLESGSHKIVHYSLVKDDEDKIRAAVEALKETGEVQVLVINGGTGLSSRDRTPEAVLPLMNKEIEGFGELFRYLSYLDVGSPALLSRARAGVVGSMVTFLLPGSPKAAGLAMEKLILPEISHLVFEVTR